METIKNIVLVEDDERMSDMIQMFLESEGFAVHVIHDGKEAGEWIPKQQPDLVLLDLMLPGMDGIAVCKTVRPHYQGPIIMLTAKDDEFTEISALNIGVDDFMTKPVRPHLLKARINVQLRRQTTTPEKTEDFQCQNLTVDWKHFTVELDGNPIELTDAEFEVLSFLVKNAGKIVSRDEIFAGIRGIEYDGEDRSIDMRISTLRKKLGDTQAPNRFIRTIRSRGYCFMTD